MLLLHGFSGDSHAAGGIQPGHPTPGWWHGLIGPGLAIDTDRYWVVCPNAFGGCQGSCGPSSLAADGVAYGQRFPLITIRDQVACELGLADHLATDRWHAVIGGPMGGMRALEWAVTVPERVPRLGLLATAATASPEQEGWHRQELAALALPDSRAAQPGPRPWPAPLDGLALARAIALISYGRPDPLSPIAKDVERLVNWGAGQASAIDLIKLGARLCGLRHQHQQLLEFLGRFEAHSYRVMCGAMTQHDIGRNRGGVGAALDLIQARTVVVSIASDRLFPPPLQAAIAAGLPNLGQLHGIESRHGHDGFLLEDRQIAPVLQLMLE